METITNRRGGGLDPMPGVTTTLPAALPPNLPVALPVTVEVSGGHAEAVRGWIEGVLGWQVVEGRLDDPVPPALRLCDEPASGSGGAVVPTLLVLPDELPGVEAARLAVSLQPAGVLSWPSQREQLPGLAGQVLSAARPRSTGTVVLSIGGSAGGVGTTTVALALAGLRAWDGARTLALVRGLGLPWRTVPTAALAGTDVWGAADVAPGLDRLRVLRLADHQPLPPLTDAEVEAVVVDAGPDPDCDVLVCRPDRAGLAAVERTTAAAIVVVGAGPVPPRALRAAGSGRVMVGLPSSARVARAGVRGRVPAGLPGAWILRLRTVVGTSTGPATDGGPTRATPP